MKPSEVIILAQEIIRLDLLRDELYEELLLVAGRNSTEVLRAIQNGHMPKFER